jgi:potassium channel subfamily K protein 13
VLHLHEDNARFVLLALVMVIYMLSGAGVFMALERENEEREKRIYQDTLESFYNKYPEVNRTDVQSLLKVHAIADTAGIVGDKRQRWDYPGSFYFVGTVVSTIGK